MISGRCLALAAKVQILRNRGYALSGDEDDLKNRLQNLEREVQDPAVSAREEELWSRLIILRGYSDRLNKEMDQPAGADSEVMDGETQTKAKRVSQPQRTIYSRDMGANRKFTGVGRLR